MKTLKMLVAGSILAIAIVTAVPTSAKNVSFRFTMVRSPGLANFPACAPHAIGVVQITSTGPVEVMNVFFAGLPPNTGFDFFVIQAPILRLGYLGIREISRVTPPVPHRERSLAGLALKLS